MKMINAQFKLNFDSTFLLSLKEKLSLGERNSLKLETENFGLKVEFKLWLYHSY
jgi:hypothetical protein